jgi:hypothetical protein
MTQGNIQTAEDAIALSDLDSLLEGSLDDLADLSSFEPFPDGVHKVSVVLTGKVINKHPAVEAKFTYIEPIELAAIDGKTPKAGDTASAAYMLDNEVAQGKFKVIITPISEALGMPKLKDVVVATQPNGFECYIVTKIRKYEDKATKEIREQLDVKKLMVTLEDAGLTV